jgi:CheY-like chemotaxis protein
MSEGAPSSALTGTVLVAEDNAAMRQMLARLCREWGATVIECGNGREAVQAFAQHQPDWVLMDFAMPELDGVDATARITARYPKARIVIVSQYESDGLRQAALEAGARGFVNKEDVHQLPDLIQAIRPAKEPEARPPLGMPVREAPRRGNHPL